MLTLAVIPARAGSRGIPRKNERRLAGKTLVERAVEVARSSGVVDRVVLSTDSDAIAELGRAAGAEVPFLRPPELATDEAPMVPVVQHAVHSLEAGGWRPELVVLLQPTAPLRTREHVRQAVEQLLATGATSVVSVVPIPAHMSPHYAMKIDGGRLEPFLAAGASVTRRQDAPPAVYRDGTVYVVRREVLMESGDLYGENCRPLLLRPRESMTLDEPEDWTRAEELLAAR